MRLAIQDVEDVELPVRIGGEWTVTLVVRGGRVDAELRGKGRTWPLPPVGVLHAAADGSSQAWPRIEVDALGRYAARLALHVDGVRQCAAVLPAAGLRAGVEAQGHASRDACALVAFYSPDAPPPIPLETSLSPGSIVSFAFACAR